MSAPPGRSATVSSLSGRVNALKFMQRASPSANNTPTKPTASSSQTPLASPSPAPASPSPSIPGSPAFGGAAVEEEQWSLSPAAIAKLRAKAAGSHRSDKKSVKQGPTISQEAGFDAWLITRDKEQQGDSSEAKKQGKTSQRQTFGKLGKKQDDEQAAEQQDTKKRSRGRNNDDDRDAQSLEPDFESQESEEEEEPQGFVKPGSFSNKSNNSKKHGDKQQSTPSVKKAKKNDKGKDQDKVVFARKRGGKPGISGGGR